MTLDEPTHKILRQYLHDVRALPNESAKTHRFSALIAEMFPGTSAATEFTAGVEKFVRIDTATGTKRGRIDAYHGNAVIEFERSLKATGDEAERQLREYTAGVWKKEGRRQLVCVASDGIVWKTYRPRLTSEKATITPDDIELEPLRTLEVKEETLGDFWIWLTSLLFRPARTDPSAERFRVDFGATSPAFADAMEALSKAWVVVSKSPEPLLAFDTWQRYLTVTYGQLGTTDKGADPSSELGQLFLKHTYLASIARLLIWASISKGKVTGSLRQVAGDILSGRFFQAQNIANMVDDDFFQWVRSEKAEEILAPVWERTLDQMLTYELSRLNQDVLKGVYQELVDPKDRHDLGEYYTPEWLCERVVAELLPSSGFVSVLDPSCGSGSFLRATIAHLLETNKEGGEVKRLRAILDNVVGIDIHPLAVIIAKATYLLAVRSLVKATKRPIHIPVYLADALFLPHEVSQLRLGEVPSYEIRFAGNRRVSIPEDLIKMPDLFDEGVAAASKLAVDHAATGKENEKTLRAYLKRAVPHLFENADPDAVVESLWKFTAELSDLIKNHQNSIWAFVVRNSYRPAMFKGRFDYIVGNPPWLSYRYIADPEYQEEVKKRAVNDYAIAPKSGKLFTQMELATIFLVHTLTTFGRTNGRIGFVIPRSVLSADQHENFRLRTYKAPMRVDKYWDLLNVRPIFNVPTCVVFATKGSSPQPVTTYTLPAVEWRGQLPARDISWSDAESYLVSKKVTARLIYLGSRSAFSTQKGRTFPNKPSRYASRFHQGATILPRNFYFVRIRDLDGKVDPDRLYWVETDPEQAEDAKPPYQDVYMSGHVEGNFIFSTALSKHLLPFALLKPPAIVLPIREKNGAIEMVTAKELREEGYREFATWMEQVEITWSAKRKGKADKQTAYERLDYNKELTTQNLKSRYLVLYNAAGTNLSAATVDRNNLEEPFLVEHKLYWGAFDSCAEANFVTAILNADVVNEEIKPFQSHGLMGERDIEKKVLELPIPVFDTRIPQHKLLADLGQRAQREATRYVASNTLPASLARQRALVRKAVSDILTEINDLVGKLLS